MDMNETVFSILVKEVFKDKEKKKQLVDAAFKEIMERLPKEITSEILDALKEGDFYDLIYDELRPLIKAKVKEITKIMGAGK